MNALIAVDLAKWAPLVSAYSSVLSVIVASIAASFAYRAYRKQAGQLALAQKHDLRWQAGKVTAWISGSVVHGAVYDLLTKPDGENPQQCFSYINASDLPVNNVRLIYRSTNGGWVSVYERPRLMPTEEPGEDWIDARTLFPESAKLAKSLRHSLPPEVDDDSEAARWTYWSWVKEEHGGHRAAMAQARGKMYTSAQREWKQVLSTAALYFDDSEGNRWRRALDGGLEISDILA